MTLFVRGNFVLALRRCALVEDRGGRADRGRLGLPRRNLRRLAVSTVGKVIGITGGGVPFAMALRKYATAGAPGILVCDDVLTTGESFRIAFDRSGQPLPAGAFALFSLNVTRIAR